MINSINFYSQINKELRYSRLRVLVSAVLHQTARDWDKGKNCKEIQTFLYSRNFIRFAEFLELNPEEFRKKLIAGEYDRKLLHSPKPYH